MEPDKVNDILIRQLEKMSDDNLKGSELGEEVERARAMALLVSQYVSAETLKMRREFMENQKAVNARKVAGYIG